MKKNTIIILTTITSFIFISFLTFYIKNAFFNFSCEKAPKSQQKQCTALIRLYENTKGNDWKNKTGWKQKNRPCEWYGVGCDEKGNIISLNLSYNNLTGSIPKDIISLNKLQDLNLSINNLSVSIPNYIGSMNQLRILNLSNNNFSGSIPNEIGRLNKLSTLNLAYNRLTDSIPNEIGNLNNLNTLNLSYNRLSNSIPNNIGNLVELKRLDLYRNDLSNNIPKEIVKLKKLEFLYINFNNNLTGQLPLELRDLKLIEFKFDKTYICEPEDKTFQNWLGKIKILNRTKKICKN